MHTRSHNNASGQCRDKELVSALFKYGKYLTKLPSPSAIIEDKDICKVPAEEHRQEPIWLFPKKPSCAACIAAGRRGINEQAKMKPLFEISVNTIQKLYGSKEWVR